MANYGIRIGLLKLKGAFMKNIVGNTATKRCVIIPVDDNDCIFLGEKDCYLNLDAIELENPRYDDTHFIKGNIPREVRERMTKEERDAMPILGNMKPLKPREPQQMTISGTISQNDFSNDDEDLPF